MLLFVTADFFRRRKPRRATDDIPAGPLLGMLIFWVLFGIGPLTGGISILAALTGRWLLCVVTAAMTAAALAGAIVSWMRLNRLD